MALTPPLFAFLGRAVSNPLLLALPGGRGCRFLEESGEGWCLSHWYERCADALVPSWCRGGAVPGWVGARVTLCCPGGSVPG